MSIENYVLGKLIGKGSYGEVNLAKSKIDKKWVYMFVFYLLTTLFFQEKKVVKRLSINFF